MRRMKFTESAKTLKEGFSPLRESLNAQYNFELYSALVYEQLSNQSRFLGFEGLAHYFHEAAEEEFGHAHKFSKIIQDLESLPEITSESFSPISTPTGFIDLIEIALEHEKEVSARVRSLLAESRSAGDYNTEKFLLEFVNEQVEEEAKYNDILARINSFGGSDTILLTIDKELGSSE